MEVFFILILIADICKEINQPILSRKLKIFLNYFVGPALFVWLSFSIYHQVKQQGDVQQSWYLIKAAFLGPSAWKIGLVMLLMLLNWGIEAYKWQLLVSRLQKISFLRAFSAIFSGQAFALNTINRAGDFVGRVLYLEEGNRLRAVALSLVGSISQLLVTFAVGIFALVGLRWHLLQNGNMLQGLSEFWLDGLIIGLIPGILCFALFYFELPLFTKLVEKIPFVHRFRYLIEKVEALSKKELTRILLLSFIRYLVFVLQYVVLLEVFGVEASKLDLAMMVAVLFLVMAMVPTIALAELGFRGKISLQLFGLLSVNTIGIVSAAAGIWIINLILPAIIGSILMVGIRLFKR